SSSRGVFKDAGLYGDDHHVPAVGQTEAHPGSAAAAAAARRRTRSHYLPRHDGKLSFEEFNAYFADGILTTEELQELFFSIDGRKNNNLGTDKLSDYFSDHLGEYLNVLSALESLNVAILKAMDKTKEVSF
uniref:N-terminal EF-hand calcium binding protein 3 n=1 Tax=Gasterosteus aculeatus aculeatus TaxID=481459 RepID=A0AAQ4P0T9_GASAC